MLSRAVDTALDRTIAPGYGRAGLALRRRLPGWPADPPRMDGRVALVTGGASGIGRATAAGLARLGARVWIVVRGDERAERAAAELRAATGGDVRGLPGDVSTVRSLRRIADRLKAEERRLDVLVNNAGTMPPERTLTDDGIELTFATHVLAPFALTELLSDLLTASAPARVINVVSGGLYAQRLDASDLQSQHSQYRPARVYARTKRAELIVTEEWARRLEGSGVVVHAMHPGWADTPGLRTSLAAFRRLTKPILRTDEEGADTVVWLAAAPEPLARSGLLWHDRRPRPTHYRPGTRESESDRRRLWDAVAGLAAG